jgi:hypothetical protein
MQLDMTIPVTRNLLFKKMRNIIFVRENNFEHKINSQVMPIAKVVKNAFLTRHRKYKIKSDRKNGS